VRRLILAAAVGAAVVGTAVPSLALSVTPPGGGVPVGTSRDGGKVCVWFSEQVPQCVDANPVLDTIPGTIDAGPVSVTVSTANNGVAVGTALGSQPLVGASVSSSGTVCVGFSLQVPICIPAELG